MTRNFHGTLTLQNIKEVVQLIEEKLNGKRYTFVTSNEFFQFVPDVRVGQILKGECPVTFWFDQENDPPKYVGFNVNDSYGVWGLSTSQTEPNYDPEFNAPYVVVDYHQIKMTLRAPAGHKIYWIVATENE